MIAGDAERRVRRLVDVVPGLAEHGAEVAHLEHQPLDGGIAPDRIGGQELARLVGEIHQDRAGLEQRIVAAARPVVIDDGRNLVVGRDFQERGPELIALADVDRKHAVIEPAFLQHDVDLAGVARGP